MRARSNDKKNPHTSTWASAEDLVLIADALMFLINTHADVSSEAIGLNLGLSFHPHLYVVYATGNVLYCLCI